MKQRRPLPWKRLLLGFLGVFLLVRLYMEYLWIAVFFSIFLAMVLGRLLWDFVQEGRRRKRLELQRLDGEQREQALRRAACANARYGGTERQTVETCIRETFGSIACTVSLTEPGGPEIDAALIPPDRVSPYWRAVTIGAGACAAGETRMELALLVMPDWEEGEDWPLRVLRDAVRSFLIVQGQAHPGMTCRSFHLTSRGFAGAVLLEDLSSQYPLEPLTLLPTGETLRFYWLTPLLKPEWRYLEQRERGYAALVRRLASIDPAVPVRRLCEELDEDPPRASCVDPQTWFQEDIAPFVCTESGGRWCLGLDTGEYCRELFLRAGLSGTGWDWERLARAYLRRYQPDDGPFVEYACEERVFFAASEDGEILRRMALGLSDLLRYEPDRILALLVPAESVRKGTF